jgi:hypothetical protein
LRRSGGDARIVDASRSRRPAARVRVLLNQSRVAGLGRRFVLLAAIALIVLAARFAAANVLSHRAADLSGIAQDFRVAYCGAEALRAGADPYHVEPLRSCEHRVGLEPGEQAWAVTPLPLPGYAIALFVPLTFLPFALAKMLWIVALVLAAALAAAAVAAIARVPTLAVGLIFWPTIGGGLNLAYGEPVPLAIAALCCAGYALERGAFRSAAVLAVLAAVEPHVAAPAILALAILVPRARLSLAVALVAGAALSFAVLGPARNLEYVTVLLPTHGLAELLARDQFGLSRYLHLLGVPAKLALTLGGVSYLATIAFGISVARGLAANRERPALLVLFPVATAMLGGSFIHDVQIAAALPAATLLAPSSRLARVSIALLAVNWTLGPLVEFGHVAAAAVGTAFVAFQTRQRRERVAWILATPLVTLALLAALGHVSSASAAADAGASGGAPHLSPTDSASKAWALRIALTPGWHETSARDIVEKIPIWTGLALLFFAGAAGAAGTLRRDPVARKLLPITLRSAT